MADAIQKRAHDSGDGGSDVCTKRSSTSKSIDGSSETFDPIVYASSYVDKSVLIYQLFHHETVVNGKMHLVNVQRPSALITAPRLFGKSVNMDMVKCFLEMHDEEIGKNLQLDESKNYNLFNGLNIMKPEFADFVKEHFAKYPILKASFLCNKVISKFDNMVDFCKIVVHDIFKQYQYLKTSSNLSDKDKELCMKWCCNVDYKSMGQEDIEQGLKVLCEYLCMHFEKRHVFVLIDDYDSPIMKAMFNPKMNSNELSEIREFYTGFLGSVLKENDYVFGAVVTGISYIASMGVSGPFGPLTHYRFLDQEHFNGFYGFTSEEVTNLFKKFSLTEHHENMARQTYNGYCTRDDKIVLYNPYSIIRYLADNKKVPISYWVNSVYVRCLEQAFQFEVYRNEIMKLLGNQSVTLTVKHKIEKEDIEVLANLSSEDKEKFDIDVCLTFLLDQGYLSYLSYFGRCHQTISDFRIPNEEIRGELVSKLRDYFVRNYNIDKRKIYDCSRSFEDFVSSLENPEEFVITLPDFRKKLKDLLFDEKVTDVGKPNHATLQQIIFISLSQTTFMNRTEVFSSVKTTADIFLFRNKCGVIIEIKCAQNQNDSRNNETEALKQIFKNKYDNTLLNDESYFPEGEKECILMGLCINAGTKDISMCCMPKFINGEVPSIEYIDEAMYI